MPDLNLHDYHDEDIVNVETHHEKSDVNVRALLTFVVVFIVFAAVTHVVLYFMYRQFAKLENRHQNVPLTMMQRPESMVIPATPRLQPFPTKSRSGVIPPMANTPVTDMVEMRTEQETALNSYGYVDRQKGIVHIPIAEAKQLALQRGVFKGITSVGQTLLSVPAAQPPQTPAQTGVSAPQTGATP